jgi:hypothetical protein
MSTIEKPPVSNLPSDELEPNPRKTRKGLIAGLSAIGLATVIGVGAAMGAGGSAETPVDVPNTSSAEVPAPVENEPVTKANSLTAEQLDEITQKCQVVFIDDDSAYGDIQRMDQAWADAIYMDATDGLCDGVRETIAIWRGKQTI